MKPVVIIAAVPQEVLLFEKALSGCTPVAFADPKSGFSGYIADISVIITIAGVGKINAAVATALAIERYQPQMVINCGCAGAYEGSGLVLGDLVVVDEEVLADEGVETEAGWHDLRYMGIQSASVVNADYYNILPLSETPRAKAIQLAADSGISLHSGRSATVSTCSGRSERGAELRSRWSVMIENMEGGAVAQVCLQYGVDCLEIRGISNTVEDRDLKKWDIPLAVENAQRFVLRYLEAINLTSRQK